MAKGQPLGSNSGFADGVWHREENRSVGNAVAVQHATALGLLTVCVRFSQDGTR